MPKEKAHAHDLHRPTSQSSQLGGSGGGGGLGPVALVAGSSHRGLAERVAAHLGLELCETIAEKFSNTECRVEVLSNVRSRDVYIIQTGGWTEAATVNDHLMETLILIDGCRRSHATAITVVMPCFPYGRQDKKDRPRVPMSGQLVANLLQTSGASRLMFIDLHAAQIQGFFHVPVDNLYALDLLCDHLRHLGVTPKGNYVMVSPHTSGAKRCFAAARKLGLSAVIMDTRRSPTSSARSTTLLGSPLDVEGRHCVVLDDVADTMGTVMSAVRTLMAVGAKCITLAVTHGMFSGSGLDLINAESAIVKVVVCNTLPQERNLQLCAKLEVVDVSELLARAIRIMQTGGSLAALFDASDRLGTSFDLSKAKVDYPLQTPPLSPIDLPSSSWLHSPSNKPNHGRQFR